jgi:hypothetical protein
VQEKSDKFSEYSERTEALARILGKNVSDLPAKIGVSNSMFYAYRTGKYPISAKAWKKLEAAERSAGIGALKSENAKSSGNLKDSGAGVSSHVVNSEPSMVGEDPTPYRFTSKSPEQKSAVGLGNYFERLAETADLDWLLDRMELLRDAAADGDAQSEEILRRITPVVWKRIENLKRKSNL